MTHKTEILCFHSADDGVLHKPGCPVGFYSHEFHCNLIYMEQEKLTICIMQLHHEDSNMHKAN